jgi:CoA:oxalate CoA-transferase
MPGPLADIKVLDLTWVLSGPYAAMTLCDLGAEVIKVERPPFGDVARTTGPFIGEDAKESSYFFSINRGKKSTVLDLKKPEGKDLFLRLVDKVDVVMENFTPGSMDRLGLGYEALAARNPRIIYAATSGFGQTGPDRDKPALDVVVQGMGGIMSITGEEGSDRPVRPGISLGDIAAGLYTTIGILAALHERESSGKGQFVDVSMLDCQIAIEENAFSRYFATGQPPKAIGTRHPATTPFQAFPTKDGHIVIALGFGLDNIWDMFCIMLGLPEIASDPRFTLPASRTRNHAALEPLLNGAFSQKTTAEWLPELEALSIPCGPMNTIPEAAEYPQIKHRGMLQEVESARGNKLTISNHPVKFSRSEAGIRGGPPTIGADTRDVLGDLLGLDDAAIDAEFARGAAVVPQDLPDDLVNA